jgi:tetratricopeptide (TPR) repeat protein
MLHFLMLGALAAGPQTTASREALTTWLGPGQPSAALQEARTAIDAALAGAEAEDPDTWVQGVRVYGHVGTHGDGDAAAIARLQTLLDEAIARGVDKERIAREVQTVSLKLTRLAMNTTLAARRHGDAVDPGAAYGWAVKALELDALAEELGFPISAQHASTLSVAASTAVDAGKADAAMAHYEALRRMGQRDTGVARQLATRMAREQGPDAAVTWLRTDLSEERDDIALLELAADLYLEADRPADAVATVLPYMAVLDGFPAAWRLLGRTQERAGELDDARASVDRCLAIDPEDVACLWARARIPYRAGAELTVVEVAGGRGRKNDGHAARRKLWKEALHYLERARAVETDDVQVNAALLAIYTEFGEKSKVEALKR